MFYRKKKLELGVGVVLTRKLAKVHNEFIDIATTSTKKLNLVEGQNQKGA